ncbi:MAG: ClbS/DfsB family four-helix bundle protein, partial [Propionibacteriaceae bacterium]|nr:ClbS/DfsB family four-helix bundle protein [Propionibacteriaceae bacterium]MDR1214591.1 ClbS/DfsB family four-helix bundle protein [Propionibacteriaceae bacterium]
HTNDELFSRGVYPWTKSTTLGAYFVSATSSHYDWAMKKLRKHKRTFSG